MDKEKMFNLQLTIQKLEEELSLYRNGTTAEEMFELIKEKEVEIDALKQKLLAKEDTLRRIAKSSSDVLNKYDVLLAEKTKSDTAADEFNNKLQSLEQSLNKVSVDRDQQVNASNLKIEQIVTDSTKQHSILSQTISKLRSENAELINTITEKSKSIKEFQQAILKYETDLSDVKSLEQKCENLTKSLSEKELLITRLKESAEDNDTHIDKLQKRCADLVTEKADKFRQLDAERQEMINHVQKFRVRFVLHTFSEHFTHLETFFIAGVHGFEHLSERRGAAEEGRQGQGGESNAFTHAFSTD
jgi:chromosome segregation ATPase